MPGAVIEKIGTGHSPTTRHLLTPVGVKSTVRSRHLTDLAECSLRILTIRTPFGRATSRGSTPEPMTLHALPERTVTTHVGGSAARHGQSDQCMAAWDSSEQRATRSRHHSIASGRKTGRWRYTGPQFYGEHCGSQQSSPPAQRLVLVTLTAIPGSPCSLRRIGMLHCDHMSDARQ